MTDKEVWEQLIQREGRPALLKIYGMTGSGKTTIAVQLYQYLVNQKLYSSEHILTIVQNRYQSLRWSSEIGAVTSGAAERYTYPGFIRRELSKFWPLVVIKCARIQRNKLVPKFASTSLTQFLMESYIKEEREKNGYFYHVTASNRQIAVSILDNINKAAAALVPFEEIGQRIYQAKPIKQKELEEVFRAMDSVVERYVETLLQTGILDTGLSKYVYHTYLLRDPIYATYLKRQYTHVIFDNFEEADAAQKEFLQCLAAEGKSVFLFENKDCREQHKAVDFFEEYMPKDSRAAFWIQGRYTCTEALEKVANVVESLLQEKPVEGIRSLSPLIKLCTTQFHSEMVKQIINRVITLLEMGEKPENIVVISSAKDAALAIALEEALLARRIFLYKTYKEYRYKEIRCNHTLLVMAALYYEIDIGFKEEDYKEMFCHVLQIDPVRASILAKAVHRSKTDMFTDSAYRQRVGEDNWNRYMNFTAWIDSRRQKKLTLAEFFRRAYLEILLPLPGGKQEIADIIKVVEEIEAFSEVMGALDSRERTSEICLMALNRHMEDYLALQEVEEKNQQKNAVILTTPTFFISSSCESAVQIWADIANNAWSPKISKELSNEEVLSAYWKTGDFYTDEIENLDRKERLTVIVKRLLRRCKKEVYAFKSAYSVFGYTEESMLSQVLEELMDGGGGSVGI